ncbi:hypothetical protein ACQP2F_09555 [Actinoplanes sp. CA-030573]|uniref:hypothetical protein n=1 Tax=Actinoplanes sp. CA-030573 TaxID=3239898 RepID=UPI003D94050A
MWPVRLGRLGRLARAVAVPLVAVVWTPVPAPVPDRHSGVPGERFVVFFPAASSAPGLGSPSSTLPGSSGCEVWFDLYPRRRMSCDGGWAVVAVPISPPRATTLRWRSAGRTGEIPFAILHVDVDAAPDPVTRGDAVTVTFAGDTPKLLITSCRVAARYCRDRPSWRRSVLLPIPADAPEGRELPFTWSFSYQFGDDAGGLSGTSRVWIALPPPSFAVRPMPATAGPGIPPAVAFTSQTPGVTITACGLSYRGAEARCDSSGIVALPIPPETPPGVTITFEHELSYTSTRPGEPDNTIHRTLPFRTAPNVFPFLPGAEAAPSPPSPTSPSASAASASAAPASALFPGRAWWLAGILVLGGLLTWRLLHRRRSGS